MRLSAAVPAQLAPKCRDTGLTLAERALDSPPKPGPRRIEAVFTDSAQVDRAGVQSAREYFHSCGCHGAAGHIDLANGI